MDEKDGKVEEEKKEVPGESKVKPEMKENVKPIKPVGEQGTLTEKMRANPWIISTLVLGIIVLILLVGNFSGGLTGGVVSGGVISSEAAGNTVLELANAQVGNVELIEVNEKSGLYEVVLFMQGTEVPVYLTKDGENLVGGLTPLSVLQDAQNTPTQQTPTEVPKTDKPEVELFVMSYCPYGTQAEKGLLPVVALLGDKIDFNLRFVHYILHGDKEDLENKRELCIREEEGQDKLNKYMVCILDSDNPQEPGDVSACEKEAGINSAKLQTCLNNKAEDYFAVDSALSEGYGVSGSPTLIINGVQSSAGRSPASYLVGICAAFNIAPSECSESLSSSSPSAGFGYNTGTDTVAQC
ncbi:MAG: hypothetical protein KKF48_00645 [Nanoarchaeota archaeon]|nr:hypothetical protein [Nanoarchaeota archaeon]MBU1027531.1 hypothetical protein [Nanoarchaeota archaeon]